VRIHLQQRLSYISYLKKKINLIQIHLINSKIIVYVADKIFSFLSQDEVEKMRQEEGKL